MKRAVMVSPGKIEIQEVPKPILKEGEALINIKAVGICGSDTHVFHGRLPFVSYPIVQGHESAGIIVETKGCKEFIKGDHVITMPQIACGECPPCKSGNYHICDKLQILGIHTDGLSAEYVAMPEKMLVKLPDDMPFDLATMIEPLSVSLHAVNLSGDVNGKNVLVIGAGIIGNLAAQVAKAKGANVMIISRNDKKLALAKKLGIDYCVNDKTENVREALIKAFNDGADITLECIGIEQSVNQSLEYARKGGTAVVLGVFGEKLLTNVFAIQDKELTVIGSMMYRKNDFEESISLIQNGKVQLSPLASAHFKLDQYDEAYEFIHDGKNVSMKVIIEVE